MENDNTEEIGKQAAALSLIEVGLGSFLHSFKIPLSGHVLSINQIALLSRACFKLNSQRASLQISLITSLLKSLSPAGKKLTPMLAITAQGIFFYFGLIFFGVNYVGLIFAVLLSSLWAFVQPVLFIYILYGKNSLTVAEYFLHEFERYVPRADQIIFRILFGLIILKFVVAFFISLFAIKLSDRDFEKYHNKMLLKVKAPSASGHSAAHMALKDLFNPLFLFSFILTTIFFIFSNSSLSIIQIIWGLLRPFALGFIIFYAIRVYPIKNISALLHRKGFIQLGKILDVAIEVVRKSSGL
jgi:hypothetical protein